MLNDNFDKDISEQTFADKLDSSNSIKARQTKKFQVIKILVIIAVLLLGIFSVILVNSSKNSVPDKRKNIVPEESVAKICSEKRYLIDEALSEPENVCVLQINSNEQLTKFASYASSFSNLEVIYLNAISASVPREIENVASLTTLNFHHTVNTVLPDIGKLQNLEIVYLSKADVKIIPESLGNLKRLTQLIVNLNTEPVTIPVSIKNLLSLKVLTLKNNKALILPDLSYNQNIEYLDLTGNNLKTIPESVYGLAKLKTLNIGSNNISQVNPNISKLSNLFELRLEESELSELPDLSNLQNLESINLSGNNLTRLPPGIESLSKLKYINLSGNKINEKQILELRKKLPNAQIVH